MAMELFCRTKAAFIGVRKMPRRKRMRIYFGQQFDFTLDNSQAEKIYSELKKYFGDEK